MNHMNKEFHVIPNDVDSYNIIDTTTDEIITNKLFDSRLKNLPIMIIKLFKCAVNK